MKSGFSVVMLLSTLFGLVLFAGAERISHSPGIAHADAEDSSPPSLVIVDFGSWDGLEKMRGLGLQVLDVQEAVLLAVTSGREIEALRALGLDVVILDAPAALELYYLASTPASVPPGLLELHAQTFPYVSGISVLKAEAEAIELLVAQGVMVVKLIGTVVLPSEPPSLVAAPSMAALAYDPLIDNLVQSVSQTSIRNHIRELQDDPSIPGWDSRGSRYTFSSKLPGKRDYIKGQMEQALGASNVRYHNFEYYGTRQNIEGTLPGWGPSSEVVYIACAHYDSISQKAYYDRQAPAPGADDNASGTAGVLEAARVLGRYRFERTLRFVTFAAEEQGIYGSYYYAGEAVSKGTNIGGALNMDMIGWDSNDDWHMDIHAGTLSGSQTLGVTFSNAVSTYSLSLVPQLITSGSSRFSDHSRFWDRGYPAVMLIEDYYPNRPDFNLYYHTTSDTLDHVKLPFATDFVRGTVATLAELAHIIPPGLRIGHWGGGPVTPGTQTVLTVSYDNPGPDAVTGVVITDTLSAKLTYVADSSGLSTSRPAPDLVVWQVGTLAPHTRRLFTMTLEVHADLMPGVPVSSTVVGTGVTTWDDPADNQATWRAGAVSDWNWLPLVSN